MTNFQSIHIGILSYPDAQESTILGLRDLFIIANQCAQKVQEQSLPELTVDIINLEDQIDYTDIAFLKSYTKEKKFSVLIIPPDLTGIPSISTDDKYIKFLQYHHKKGTILASVCTGAFLLAETGLLTHKNVTTHWQYIDLLAQKFPNILLNPDQLLVDDKDIITASGGMCWGDLGLCLIKRLLGPIVMAETSKKCLMQTSQREQRHFCVFHPRLHHDDDNIFKVQKWIENTKIKSIINLRHLTEVSQLTTRTLQRRFIKATGLTITEYLQRYRIHQSQVFLQFTEMPIQQIVSHVGYHDHGAFCKIFMRIVGMKPTIYRQLFSMIE